MNKSLTLPALALALVLAAPTSVQAEDEKETYIYSSYFYCKGGMLGPMDAELTEHLAPVYDAAVADGTIGGWGWLAHHTGGKWSRAFYTMSDSLPGLFAAQNTMMERSKDLPSEAFEAACTGHEDYIWKTEANNGTTGKRGKAGLSVYHVCDINREQKADELVKTVMAPHYDKAVEQGKLTSWGWNSHVVGGKYRRLATMTGDSFEAILAAREEILEALYDEDGDKRAWEFSEICASHSDYLWMLPNEGRP